MLRSLRLIVPALLLALLIGSTSGCGIGRTPGEAWREANRSTLHDIYMLTDDTSLLLQTDRPHRGSRWVVE